MTDTDCKEDEVLKQMLKTPPKKNEPTTPLGKRRRDERDAAEPGVPHLDGKPFKSSAEANPFPPDGIQTTQSQR